MFGLTAQEFAQMEREVGDGPGDEIVPIGPLMAKFIINGVRAGNTQAMAWLDEIMAKDGVPRPARKAEIYKLKRMGPAPDPTARSANDFIEFLKGHAS